MALGAIFSGLYFYNDFVGYTWKEFWGYSILIDPKKNILKNKWLNSLLDEIAFLKRNSYSFMKKAGYEVFKFIRDNFKKEQSIIVLCGPGNNGGDGFIAANHLLKGGYNTKVYTLSNKGKYSGDALLALKNFKGQVKSISFLKIIPNSFIIDALFGIGLKRKIGGRLKNII